MKSIAKRVEVPRGSSGRAARRTEASAPDGRIQFSLSSPESLNRLSFARSTYASLTKATITPVNWTFPCLFELGNVKVDHQYVKEKGLGMTSTMRLPISSRCLIVSFPV